MFNILTSLYVRKIQIILIFHELISCLFPIWSDPSNGYTIMIFSTAKLNGAVHVCVCVCTQ